MVIAKKNITAILVSRMKCEDGSERVSVYQSIAFAKTFSTVVSSVHEQQRNIFKFICKYPWNLVKLAKNLQDINPASLTPFIFVTLFEKYT